ncbi:hypothetical protein HNP84_004423 [Thermocatellispora tengchongensis]|uniref:AMIN-like domain-containing protein n=1 Tax=Thermocatellispora tengchongensis TaxID=1073253 RepID=A0A840P6R0_9ACTN|nr:hypothetical protein [Thermocatellispora tengchongensis]MBB5134689.1 hypothetical protein [Thermocatellispora tengchongensis]
MNASRTARALAVLAVSVVLLAGCGGGGPGPAPSEPASTAPTSRAPEASTPAPSPSSPTAEPTQAALGPPTATGELEVVHELAEPTTVTGARYARHDDYDRVVIDLDGQIPGYTIRWVDEVVQDGSGEPVEVPGGAYLQITLTPAQAHDDTGESTWAGGPIFQAGLPNVRSVVRNGDFEGIVSVALALDHKAGFRALEQRSPNRLVIDVAH